MSFRSFEQLPWRERLLASWRPDARWHSAQITPPLRGPDWLLQADVDPVLSAGARGRSRGEGDDTQTSMGRPVEGRSSATTVPRASASTATGASESSAAGGRGTTSANMSYRARRHVVDHAERRSELRGGGVAGDEAGSHHDDALDDRLRRKLCAHWKRRTLQKFRTRRDVTLRAVLFAGPIWLFIVLSLVTNTAWQVGVVESSRA